jgi:hypothetical protein
MKKITQTSWIFLFLIIMISSSAMAQLANQTGTFQGIYSVPLMSETDRNYLQLNHWHLSLQSIYTKNKSSIFKTNQLKHQKWQQKLASAEVPVSAQKTTGANPVIGTNFKGNELKTWTPTDNSIAVSNGGKIVSCINYGVEYYDTAGNNFLLNHTWDAFVNNAALSEGKFDPRVIYDPKQDRFIVVLLHGFSSAKTKILVAFSKTNDPMDGWFLYQMSGNPMQDTSWSDFPTIGINDDDLFINCNRFGDAPNYNWKETFIYQIALNEGYNGQALQYGIWNNISTPDGMDGITLYPASHGLGQSMKEKMYFVQLMPDSGSKVYAYRIDGQLSSPNKSMQAFEYAIPHFEVCANAFQKDPTTGNIDSLSTGSAWTQNAFYTEGVLHYTHTADFSQGWCGLTYGRIYLDSGKAVSTMHGESGTDLSYPAIASFGYSNLEQGAVMAYVRSDSSRTPECGVISIDHQMNWSNKQLIKSGDTSVNILYPPSYPIMPERWGDYTGICRKYNSTVPEAWLAAAYGTNTLPRLASFGTWIAQVKSNDPQLPLNTIEWPSSNTSKIYPNPVQDLYYLEFQNKIAGPVQIRLYDMQGKLIKVLLDDQLPVSANRLSFNKGVLATGMYQIQIQMFRQESQTISLMVQ